MNNLLEELSWRGLLQDYTITLEDQLDKESTTLYVGFDPTANSLHIGSLLPLIILIHFERFGHKPIILLGGATGMIGDPSEKLTERDLINKDTLTYNMDCIKKQLVSFLNFKSGSIRLLNNYDWMHKISFLEFSRNIGNHITVNYMMSKDSVKRRLNSSSRVGMSFTEFTYQLLQAYDFLYLYKNERCLLEIGGSDQWGNITTGIELIRRKLGVTAYGLTFPLVTRNDGIKFGKSQEGDNIWLDPKRTSPYKFFQFWMNTSDDKAIEFVKKYTLLKRETIDQLVKDHSKQPNKRILQKRIAIELTRWIHGEEACKKALNTSKLLFKKHMNTSIKVMDDKTLLSALEGLTRTQISFEGLEKGISILDVLVERSNFINSKAEARRALKAKSILVNYQKVDENFLLNKHHILLNRYILLQIGKKNHFLLEVIKN